MTIDLALRLLGYLRASAPNERTLLDARRHCIETLSLPATIDDAALLERLVAILGQRGVPTANLASSGGARCSLGGVIAPSGGVEGTEIEVVSVELDGREVAVLAQATVNAHGEFHADYVGAGARLIRVRVVRDGEVVHYSAPIAAGAGVWFEWAASGQAPRPSPFEIREAWLAGILATSDLILADLVGPDHGTTIAALSALAGIPIEQIKHHIMAAALAKELELPADLVAALLPELQVESGTPRAAAPIPSRMAAQGFVFDTCRPGAAVTIGDMDDARALVVEAASIGAIESHVDAAIQSGRLSSRHGETAAGSMRALARRGQGATTDRSPILLQLAKVGVAKSLVEQVASHIASNPTDDAAALLSSGVASGEGSEALRCALEVVELAANDLRALDGLASLSGRAVARLSTQELAARLERAVPAAERQALAEAIAANADTRFPADALLRRRRPGLAQKTSSFLDARGDAFDLACHSLRARELDSEVLAELAPLQRLNRLTDSAATADALYRIGYRSAQQIAFVDSSSLSAALAAEGVDAECAERIHRRARARYRATVEAYLRLDPQAAGPEMAALDSPATAGITSLPTYSFLFGSQDFGPVDDWESITSPAAYLVDLLVWLNGAPIVPGVEHPYAVLLKRRPDLVEVLLDQRNSETSVPHIDLVCELLEDAVAARLGVAGARPRRQTTLTAEEARAYPEHVDARVYAALSQSTVAMRLPFDLPLAEMRSYLGLKDISRSALLELFGWTLSERAAGAPTPRAQDLAAELLGLNKLDFTTITTPKPDAASQKQIWSQQVPFDGLAPFMSRAPSPNSSRAHLDYDGVLSLLDTAFVNPTRSLKLALIDPNRADHCRADERKFDPPLDATALDRAHRFLRLARARSGSCGPSELDTLLSATGGKLDPSGLVQLAALERLRARLHLGAEEAAALFRPFTIQDARTRADGTAPLYRRVFLLRADAGATPAIFTDPSASTPLTEDVLGRISAALNVPLDDLGALFSLAGVSTTKVAFADLWKLYRYALLARAACPSLSVRAFSALVQLLGEPLSSLEQLTQFVADVQASERDKLSLDDLRVMAGHDRPTVPPTAALDAALGRLVDETRKLLDAAKDIGEPAATDLDAQEYIADHLTWIAPVAGWLGLDPRLAGGLRLLGASHATVLLELGSAGRPDALVAAARWARTLTALGIAATEASDMEGLTPLVSLAKSPSWPTVRGALVALRVARGSATVGRLAGYLRQRADATDRSLAACAADFARAVASDRVTVEAAWRALDASDPPTLANDPQFLSRIAELTRIAAGLGLAPAAIRKWTAWPTSADAAAARDAVRSTLPRNAWLSLSRSVQDPLRENKRDALVNYIVAAPVVPPSEFEPTTTDEFMGRYLIDVEMGSCRDTTRVIQSTVAIQLLVQRCLLGLERGIVPHVDEAREQAYWRQWAWRKRYRLWEANRRIFLYPENYLTVGQASNTSPLFSAFRKRMAQTEISETTVAESLEDYVVGLEKIARLDYQCLDISADGKVLGAVAQSSGGSPTFYYRRFSTFWSPWEEVSLTANPISVVLAQGSTRAWLAWPTLTQHVHPVQPLPTLTGGSSGVDSERNAGRGVTHARYSWTMRDDRGAWSPVKTTSRASVMTPRDSHGFVMMAQPDYPSPYTFQLLLYTPQVNSLSRDVSYTFSMEIVRDAGRSWIRPELAFPGQGEEPTPEPRWREHYAEYRMSAPVQGGVTVRPWDRCHFDGNRMIAAAQQQSGEIVDDVALKVPLEPARVLLTAKAPLIATKAQAVVNVGGGIQQPKVDAFVVSGAVARDAAPEGRSTRWSLLMLAPSTASSLLASSNIAVPSNKVVTVAAYHPFAEELITRIRGGGLRSLYQPRFQESPTSADLGRPPLAYRSAFGLEAANVAVLANGAVVDATAATATEAFDFDAIAPYALYNWELFFDAPLFVAQRLTAKLSFREAQAYYHFVFNPLTTEDAPPRSRFWITKPFRKEATPVVVEDLLIEAVKTQNRAAWQAIEDSPFDAHAIAATRPSSRQRYVVMSYLDNLIAWGDQHYRQGTAQASREDVDEATSIYELARAILGEAPNRMRPIGTKPTRAFVKAEDWVGGSNVLVELENALLATPEADDDSAIVHLPLVPSQVVAASTAPKSLYFRVPANDKLLKYWDVVATRLANIRACLTIDGAVANLPLTAAQIDPQALADAAARGVSVADAIAMTNPTPPVYRFRIMLAKARECCDEVRSLGAALLTALERQDGEHVAAIRSRFEQPILAANRATKSAQRKQIEREIEALAQSRDIVAAREKFYSERAFMNELETTAFDLSLTAGVLDAAAAVLDFAAGGLQLIPDAALGLSGFGGTPHANIKYGGTTVATSASHWGKALSALGQIADRSSSLVSSQAGYVRRKEDWDHQANQASLELKHLDTQIAAAKLRAAVVDAELKTQDAQDRAWDQSDRLLREKFTNADLYTWQVSRLTDVYLRAYEQAFKLAGYAHQALEFETGSTFERPSYDGWDRAKNGLLAAEELGRYLRDLDFAFHGRKLADRVINQHISLRQIAPAAFANLVTTGSTGAFTIPAWRLAQLYPGVTKRRIRSVAVSVPCIAGPHASVNATLRFVGTDRTVTRTISLSTGREDFGWDMTTRADAYVPFEGIGLDDDTQWQLDFPVALGRPDVVLSSISDAVLHFEYGASEGTSEVKMPASFDVVVDVARSAPDTWALLTSGDGPHARGFDVSRAIPSFISEYHLRSVKKALVLDDNGREIPGAFDCRPDATHGPDALSITPTTVPNVPWSHLRHLILVLDVSP